MKLTAIALIMSLALAGLPCSASASRILIEDNGEPVKGAKSKSKIKTADDGMNLRRLRRAGIGASAAGPLGLYGINLELNFSGETGLMMGFGGSPDFQSFMFQMKHVLGGRGVMPYFAGGFARWYNFPKPGDGPIKETTPNLLAEKFLNEKHKKQGRISENLVYPGFGIQFMQLTGPWAGSSVFMEVLMLLDIEDLQAAPTGTLGYLYYF